MKLELHRLDSEKRYSDTVEKTETVLGSFESSVLQQGQTLSSVSICRPHLGQRLLGSVGEQEVLLEGWFLLTFLAVTFLRGVSAFGYCDSCADNS